MKEVKVDRKHKDKVFCRLFSEKDNALSLFNAVNRTDFTNADDLKIITLEDSIYMAMKNDVAVLFHDCINLYEHQSTVNPNMPLREFLYMAHEYEGLYAKYNSAVYHGQVMRLPAPECFVFYNGANEQPDYMEYKLSDAFSRPSPGYEWTSKVVNINWGCNKEIMEKCPTLAGYSYLCENIRKNKCKGESLEKAVSAAIDSCIGNGYLINFLAKHKGEVEGMLFTELSEDEIKNFYFEEGKLQKAKKVVRNGMDKFSPNSLAELTEVPIELIQEWIKEFSQKKS